MATVDELKRIGVPIVQLPDGDIKLERLLYPLKHGFIRDWVSEHDSDLGSRIEFFDSIDSTNQYLLTQAGSSNVHKQSCVAEHMTAGRGRQQRRWFGGAYENIMFSIGWRFGRGATQLSGLSLAVSVAALNCLKEFCGDSIRLKWPNDLLVDGRKLAGILVEVKGDVVIVGIGINCKLTPELAELVDRQVTSLSDLTSSRLDRSRLVASLMVKVAECLEIFSQRGFAPFQREWEHFHAYEGCLIRTTGSPSYEGRVTGIDCSGALLIELGNGQCVRIYSGEVGIVST